MKTPEQREFEENCRKFMNKKGFAMIIKMAESKDGMNKRWALTTLLERGYGKPTETVDAYVTAQASESIEALTGAIADLIGKGPEKGDGGNRPNPETKAG